jgi:hypothetical protein
MKQRASVEPITAADLPEVSQFLHEHLARERSPAQWLSALQTHWHVEPPNHGYMLREEGRVVGTICALYAQRVIRDRLVSTCNITSWCVLDSHRAQSMKLAMAVVKQPGHHFTDFSPTATVGGVLRFLKFKSLPEAQAVVFSLPSPAPGSRLLSDANDIESALDGAALQIYRDHRRFPWLRHALLGSPQGWCHVIYKPMQFKGLPAVKILYLSTPALFRKHLGRWCTHMLRQGIVTSHVECRFLPDRPWHSAVRTGFNAKVYLSDELGDDDIDYLYSETMAMDL